MIGFSLNITIVGSNPIIQRKITISKNCTFKQLNQTIEILFGFEDSDRYVFHINEDITLFEYSDVGYCMEDMEVLKIGKYFMKNNTYGYEYNGSTQWLLKIKVINEITNALAYPDILSIKGKYNPNKINDLITFNQLMIYLKNPENTPENIYDEELKKIQLINKNILQNNIKKLFGYEEEIITSSSDIIPKSNESVSNDSNSSSKIKQKNPYVDPNYSLDKYF